MKFPRSHLPALAAALLGLALYAITLRGTYIYDDAFFAQLDPRLHDVARWSQYLTKPYYPGSPDRLWRPLTSLSFAVEWYLHGDRPWVMHLVNTLLYAACCYCVALLARLLAGPRAAWIAGLLFAAHPLHVEAAAYLVGRADLLSTLAILTALLLFLSRPMTTPRALAIWLCMLIATLSKEPGMLLPFLLLAYLPFRRHHLPLFPPRPVPGERAGVRDPHETPPATTPHLPISPSPETKPLQLLLLLLCWTLATYIIFREQSRTFKFSWDPSFIDPTMNPLVIAPAADRWLTPFSLVGRYLELLLFPLRLSIDHAGWIGTRFRFSDPYFYLGLATVIAWWIALLISLRRRAYAAVGGLLSFVLSYAMVSNFGIVIGTIFAERLMFLPSVFFLTLLATALTRLPQKLLVPLTTILVLLAMLRTETYARLWHDPLLLYTTCAEAQPSSGRLWLLVMDQHEQRGDLQAAAAAGMRGVTARPDYWRLYLYLAQVEAEQGHLAIAESHIDYAMHLQRTDPGALAALRAKIRSGQYPALNPASK